MLLRLIKNKSRLGLAERKLTLATES
jgi:hypothetical protein